MSEHTFEPKVFAGLDEAGYGPLLGPLTYGFAAFRCARGEGPSWARLEAATSAQRVAAPKAALRTKGAQGAVERPPALARLVVADSKEVFDRTPRGMQRLESTALAFLAQRPAGGVRDGRALVTCAPPGLAPSDAELAAHPWYTALPATLPAHVAPRVLDEHGARLAAALDSAALELVDAGARVVPVGPLNRAFEAAGNKGTAHFALGGALLVSLFERFGAEGLDFTCDRLGGRMRYGAHLAGLVPFSDVRALREDPEWSEYELTRGPARMRVRFVEKGDRRWFTVALASCLAKYARELVMDAFNAHFGALDPGLAPTAGYVQDGRRWLAESAAARARAGVAEQDLVRIR
ncbi:MAG: hypothetical protein R3F49_22390 [Planctomycetota bacterium]